MKSGTHTTLPAPRRCPWCGHRCHGATCQYCRDLERAERAVWEPPKVRSRREPGFEATCGKCGDIASRGSWNCPSCGTPLYLHAPARRS